MILQILMCACTSDDKLLYFVCKAPTQVYTPQYLYVLHVYCIVNAQMLGYFQQVLLLYCIAAEFPGSCLFSLLFSSPEDITQKGQQCSIHVMTQLFSAYMYYIMYYLQCYHSFFTNQITKSSCHINIIWQMCYLLNQKIILAVLVK